MANVPWYQKSLSFITRVYFITASFAYFCMPYKFENQVGQLYIYWYIRITRTAIHTYIYVYTYMCICILGSGRAGVKQDSLEGRLKSSIQHSAKLGTVLVNDWSLINVGQTDKIHILLTAILVYLCLQIFFARCCQWKKEPKGEKHFQQIPVPVTSFLFFLKSIQLSL